MTIRFKKVLYKVSLLCMQNVYIMMHLSSDMLLINDDFGRGVGVTSKKLKFGEVNAP